MPLKLLTEDHYRGSRKGSVVSDGVSAHTHIALLDINDSGAPERCYVKLYPDSVSGVEHRGIVNEIVGHVLAAAMGAPVPKNAGLIALNSSQLSNLPSWISQDSACAGWWVQDVASPSLRAYYRLSDLNQAADVIQRKLSSARRELLATDQIHLVIALDDLIANIDRNIGNLLRIKKGTYVLIDHGLCLTSDFWVSTDLDADLEYDNCLADLLDPDSSFLPFKHKTVMAHENLVKNIEPAIQSLLKWLPYAVDMAESSAIETFIRGRAKPGSLVSRKGLFA